LPLIILPNSNLIMKRNLMYKEAFVATWLIMIIVFLLSFFPLKFEVTRPIRQELADFDIYDLYYSDRHESNFKRDPNIVLFQVGNSREEIADQLLKIDSLGPAVIGIDITFSPKEDSAGNKSLLSAMQRIPTAVYSFRLLQNDSSDHLQIGPSQLPDSLQLREGGYINFLGKEYSVVRYFAPFVTIDKKEYSSLASRILEKYSPEAFSRLKERNEEIEIINYSGNIENYDHFTTEDLDRNYSQLKEIVKGKIALLGFFSKTPLILDDLKFTPLNSVVIGKGYPDMYGVVIHANILTMLLSGKYASLVPIWISYLLAFIFTFFLILFILHRYKKNSHPAHWKFFLIQFFSLIVLVYLFLLLFSWLKIKVQLLPIIISLVLAVEMFELYKSLALWLHKKIRYDTIFHHK